MLGLVGSLLGSVASGVFGLMGQNSANDANAQQAATRYQVASADMTKAGLNPAAMFGSGGPAPMAPQLNAMAPMAGALKDAAGSAVQMLVQQKAIDQMTSQIAKTNVDAATVKAQLPAVAATAGVDARKAKAILSIPDSVFTPLVSGGFGGDSMKSLGPLGSSAGAVAAGGPQIISGLSGPAVSTARSVGNYVAQNGPAAVDHLRLLGDQFNKKAPKLWQAVGDWWNNSGRSTAFQSRPDQVQGMQ